MIPTTTAIVISFQPGSMNARADIKIAQGKLVHNSHGLALPLFPGG